MHELNPNQFVNQPFKSAFCQYNEIGQVSYMKFPTFYLLLIQGIAKRLAKTALNEAAKKREMKYEEIRRIEKGTRRYYHDDITVIVIYLDNSQGTPTGRVMDRDNFNCTTTPVDIFSLNSDQADDSPSTSPSVPIRSI